MHGFSSYRDFDRLPTSGGLFLYAIELSNGVVKVGRTGTPRGRMRAHFTTSRVRGLCITRFHIEAGGGEAELTTRLRRIAVPVGQAREFFTGVSFGAARTLVRQMAQRSHGCAHAKKFTSSAT